MPSQDGLKSTESYFLRARQTFHLCHILDGIDFYILQKAITHNVNQSVANVIKTHTRKLEKLTRNTVLPFTANETVTNISSCCLTTEQLETLKFGLTHSICPPSISKSASNLYIACTMAKKLIDEKHDGKLKADLSHLAHSYVASHRPTTADLKKS